MMPRIYDVRNIPFLAECGNTYCKVNEECFAESCVCKDAFTLQESECRPGKYAQKICKREYYEIMRDMF